MAFMSDTDEEAMSIAHEQSIRLFQEAAARDKKNASEGGDATISNRGRASRRSKGSKSQEKINMTEEECRIAHENLFRILNTMILKPPKTKKMTSTLNANDEFNLQLEYEARRRPPHPKRRASRHSRPFNSHDDYKVTSSTFNASTDGDAEFEEEADAMIFNKQPVVRMVIKPMASTPFTSSDSDD